MNILSKSIKIEIIRKPALAFMELFMDINTDHITFLNIFIIYISVFVTRYWIYRVLFPDRGIKDYF